MIWVGGGAMNAGAEVLALAEKISAPVVANRTGKGVVDARHPLSLSTLGAQPLWRETDLLIGMGTRLSIPLPGWGPAAEGLKVARIDIDPAEPRRLAVDVPIVADAADAARALTRAVARRDGGARRSAIGDAKAFASEAIAKAQPQQGFIEAIRAALPEDGILVDEMTQVAYIAWNGYQAYQPRTFITSGFSGTLGYGFPTALGVKAANPDRAVVSIAGDGGFLYAGTELATAVHHGINLVTVVFDNASYGNVLRDQKRLYDGRHAGSLLTSPDFETFARAFGTRAWRAEDPDQLRSALPEALAADAPALIVVPSDIEKDYPPYALPSPRRR
jgi:acetolactate synthase-1/2/3 large subunit